MNTEDALHFWRIAREVAEGGAIAGGGTLPLGRQSVREGVQTFSCTSSRRTLFLHSGVLALRRARYAPVDRQTGSLVLHAYRAAVAPSVATTFMSRNAGRPRPHRRRRAKTIAQRVLHRLLLHNLFLNGSFLEAARHTSSRLAPADRFVDHLSKLAPNLRQSCHTCSSS